MYVITFSPKTKSYKNFLTKNKRKAFFFLIKLSVDYGPQNNDYQFFFVFFLTLKNVFIFKGKFCGLFFNLKKKEGNTFIHLLFFFRVFIAGLPNQP